MNSLATLSAEKSKMEASFQADKKALRQELKVKEKTITELQEKVQAATAQTKLEVEKVKSKLIIERHEWEKESNNQMLMIRELQKLLSDERHLKENIEMQLNDLKMQFSKSGNSDSGHIKELTNELEQTKKKLKELQNKSTSSKRSSSPSAENVIKQLQSELINLKKQQAATIQSEQQRANRAEERNKHLAAVHEDRVANLENRLAELSTTIGSYDRLRQIDQETILRLKEKLAQCVRTTSITTPDSNTNENQTNKYTNWTVNELMNEILLLKNILLMENNKLERPIDLTKIYAALSGSTLSSLNANDKSCDCSERTKTLLIENQDHLREIERLKETIDVQKNHIKTLQAKVEVLNRNIDEQEEELRNKNQDFKNELRKERTEWKENISNLEMEFRTKQAELELQLQKQRERSLTLLEEKENEIKSLKTSFDIFMVPRNTKTQHQQNHDENTNIIDDEKSRRSKKLSSSSYISTIMSEADDESVISNSAGEGPSTERKDSMHMLHYVHELSRKEVEINTLRKARHLAETTLRQALQDKAAAQEELYDKIGTLEEQVDRLERCKSREGENLEYLKNVVLSFIISSDADSKRHMINAIGAVLKFNPNEMKIINNYFSKKEKK